MPVSKSYSSSDISTLNEDTQQERGRSRKINNSSSNNHFGTSPKPPAYTASLNPYLPSKAAKKRHRIKKKKINHVIANLALTKYAVLEKVCRKLGIIATDYDSPECFLIWSDSAVPMDRISEMKPYQKINHFPGMAEICRKDLLAKNTARLCKVFPEEYSFVPQSWILPSEHVLFKSHCKELRNRKKLKTFIVKPANGAMGNGIFLMRSTDRIDYCENYIIQEYIDKPLLLDGYKFDLRLYVFVMSIDPLKIFLYNDGLVRMGTESYVNPRESNLDCLYMHLTNYSINKHSENFKRSSEKDTGSKRSIKAMMDKLKQQGTNTAVLWDNIADVIIKTIIAAFPHVSHAYRMCRTKDNLPEDSACFEILGFDILLDRALNPWVIEVNRAPSFGTDQALDLEIKFGVLYQALKLLNIRTSDRKRALDASKRKSRQRLMRQPVRPNPDLPEAEQELHSLGRKKEELKQQLNDVRRLATKEDYENKNLGNYKRIYPTENRKLSEKYKQLIEESEKCFTGRATQKSWKLNLAIRERELLDQLEQVESDEMMVVQRGRKGRKLSHHQSNLSRSRSIAGVQSTTDLSSPQISSRTAKMTLSEMKQLPSYSKLSTNETNHVKSSTSTPNLHTAGVLDDLSLADSLDEKEKDLTKQVLRALNHMKIKFPGKNDIEADKILGEIQENWKFHKPRVASYWLVKLDSVKRRKVIDIVRSNVKAILQRVWELPNVDDLRLSKHFSKLYNRFLWGNGQGMWHCFNSNGETWEALLTRNSYSIAPVELNCCRRLVQLCRDCLLVVYQFASEARQATPSTSSSHHFETSVSRPLYFHGNGYERPSRLDLSMASKMIHMQKY